MLMFSLVCGTSLYSVLELLSRVHVRPCSFVRATVDESGRELCCSRSPA